MQLLPQRLAAAFAAAAFLLTSPTVQASPANTVQEQVMHNLSTDTTAVSRGVIHSQMYACITQTG